MLFRSSAANSLTDQKAKKVLTSIVKEIRTMPTRLLSQSNLSRIKSEGNKKVIDEFIKGGKIIQDKSYEYWLDNNKPALVKAITEFAKKNDKFYDALIYEALTGEKTLSGYKGAVANAIVSPSGFYEINSIYVKKIKSKIKMDLKIGRAHV